MAHVELKDIRKEWDTAVAVEKLDLTIEDGEFVAILGPSGCGKSTTLFMLAGIYLPTSGDILFDGARVNDVEARQRNVGIVFQSYALYPNMTALENIMFPLRFQKRADPDGAARRMADLVQVGGLLDRRPGELSGGQQQRVALARALVKEPGLLLLDEPLSNLDATLRLSMRAEIRRITRELGVTTVLVTHDQLEATTMADRVVCMHSGRIEQVGHADTLYHRPETLFVAGFIGAPSMNRIAGEGRDGRFQAGGHAFRVDDLPDGMVTLGIRPERVRAVEGGLPGTILEVEPMGRESLMLADTELGPIRFLEATGRPSWKEGDRVDLEFDAPSAIFFDARGVRIATAQLAELENAIA